jgi:hypothetical protein
MIGLEIQACSEVVLGEIREILQNLPVGHSCCEIG